jgi:hypothetical protein
MISKTGGNRLSPALFYGLFSLSLLSTRFHVPVHDQLIKSDQSAPVSASLTLTSCWFFSFVLNIFFGLTKLAPVDADELLKRFGTVCRLHASSLMVAH